MKNLKLTYIVEDDPITAIVTEEVLRKNQLSGEVQTYVNGQRAFDQLTAALGTNGDLPDLILLDLNMPRMDGWDFLAAFAGLALRQQVTIFVLTSSIHPDDRARAFRHPEVKGYFSKPIDDATVARMQEMLNADAARDAAHGVLLNKYPNKSEFPKPCSEPEPGAAQRTRGCWLGQAKQATVALEQAPALVDFRPWQALNFQI